MPAFVAQITQAQWDAENGAPVYIAEVTQAEWEARGGTATYYAQITQAEWEAATVNPMVMKAHTFPGANAGDKIAAAIAALPVNVGGIVDATGFTNPQNCTGFTVLPGVTVLLSPVLFTLTAAGPSIVVRDSGSLIGHGAGSPGATTIRAANGFNKNLIECVSTGGQSGFWHHGRVRNLRIDGNKASNTTGHGIAAWQFGETSRIELCNVFNCAQAGIYIKGSQSGTNSVDNITVNSNAVYGIQLDECRSGFLIKSCGGDNNPVTFGITTVNNGGGSLLFVDPKSEGATDVPFLIKTGVSRFTLSIVGGNMLNANGSNQAVIRIDAGMGSGSDPTIQIIGMVHGNGFNRLIHDLENSKSVNVNTTVYHSMFIYDTGVIKFDPSSIGTLA